MTIDQGSKSHYYCTYLFSLVLIIQSNREAAEAAGHQGSEDRPLQQTRSHAVEPCATTTVRAEPLPEPCVEAGKYCTLR